MTDAVQVLFERQTSLYNYLVEHQELSYAQDVEQSLRKNLALAIASQFEFEVCDAIAKLTNQSSNGLVALEAFVRNKALKRQFHTFFSWEDGKNANSFFGLFGDDFKKATEAQLKADDALGDGVKAFLEIGHLRNCIVHQNYSSYSSEKTAAELMLKYQSARHFVEFVNRVLSVDALLQGSARQ